MADSALQQTISVSRQVFTEHREPITTLLEATNAMFRRPDETPPKRRKKRGRTMWSRTKITFVVLDRDDYIRVPSRLKMLTLESNSLGQREVNLKRAMTRQELEDFLVAEFEHLSHGFQFMTSGQNRKFRGPLLHFEDVDTLKKKVKKGKVYIFPPRAITLNLTASLSDVTPAAPLSDVAPAAPLSDVASAAPLSNVTPAAPLSDVAPVASVSGVIPAAPLADVTPTAPLSDVAPVASVSGIIPAVPLADVAPAAPLSDVAPVASVSGVIPAAPLADVALAVPLSNVAPVMKLQSLDRFINIRWPSSSSDSGDDFEDVSSCPWKMSLQTGVTGVTGATIDNGGKTTTQLRAIQDDEYHQSLICDREKDQAKERETQENMRQSEMLLQLRARRKSRLQPEPADGVTFKFMMSNGRMEERRFMPDDSTDVMKNFIGSLEDSAEYFDMQPPGGPTLKLSTERTIFDIGLSNRTLIHVKWLTKEEYLEKHAADTESVASIVADQPTEEIYQEIDTPTISFRRQPQRDAAAISRIRVSEWVDTIFRINVSPPSSPQATPAMSDSTPIPEPLPHIVVSDDTFAAELSLAHSAAAVDTEFERQSTTVSLPSALKSLADNVLGDVEDGRLKIIVRRDSALIDAIQNIFRAQTRLLQPLTVRIIGEPAVDDGGPSRELSSLVVSQLRSPYVEGIEHNKMFSNDFKLYSTNKYQYLGQLTAVLILQGGQGLPVFSHSVTEYLLSGKITQTDVDLPESIRSAFKQLQTMTDGELHNRVDELFPGRFEEGYNVPSTQITRDNLPEMVQAMVAYHVIRPQKMALDQFSQGLQIGGVLEVLQQHQVEARCLLKGAIKTLTMDILDGLVSFDYSALEEGSNWLSIAKGMEQGWVLLLQAAESGEAEFQFEKPVTIDLCDILMWFSGASRLPAVGFSKKIEIYFDKEATLPRVNTCSLCAYLPLSSRFQDPENFMRQLVEWILDSQGFGLI